MEADDPTTIRVQDENAADQSGSDPAEPLDTPSLAPPEAAKTWLTLPPVAFNESESPWRKINDQTVRLSDDNKPPASPVPSEIFLG